MANKMNLHPEPLELRAQRYEEAFEYPIAAQRKTVDALLGELQSGLTQRSENPHQEWDARRCSLMLLDTCAKALPSGRETGVFYAVDVGGTNCRAVRVFLVGNGQMVSQQIQRPFKGEGSPPSSRPNGLLDPKTRADELFEFIALQVHELMKQAGDLPAAKPFAVGLTFSYGIVQTDLQHARLVNCGKELLTGTDTSDPILGSDICDKLNTAFQKLSVPAHVVACLNDTTGSMYSGAYLKERRTLPPCKMGLILGTGLNACYYEPDAEKYRYDGNVINTECGGFNIALPRTIVDLEVDMLSTKPGHQMLEKLVSGLYLSEICRRSIVRVFQSRAPELSWIRNSLSTAECARIYNDSTESLEACQDVVWTCWNWDTLLPERQIVKRLVDRIFDRSAALGAVIVCSLVKRMKTRAAEGVTIAVDGSLYKKNPKYQGALQRHLKGLIEESSLASNVHLLVPEDASGVGAAVLAAAHQILV